MKHTLDATNQSIGRMATQIATMLRGKDTPAFAPNVNPKAKVLVTNIDKAKFTGTKLDAKVYYHYSGYPGGMKERTLATMIAKNPKRVLWLAVYRMLPKNRMRSVIIKNLEIQ